MSQEVDSVSLSGIWYTVCRLTSIASRWTERREGKTVTSLLCSFYYVQMATELKMVAGEAGISMQSAGERASVRIKLSLNDVILIFQEVYGWLQLGLCVVWLTTAGVSVTQ